MSVSFCNFVHGSDLTAWHFQATLLGEGLQTHLFKAISCVLLLQLFTVNLNEGHNAAVSICADRDEVREALPRQLRSYTQEPTCHVLFS